MTIIRDVDQDIPANTSIATLSLQTDKTSAVVHEDNIAAVTTIKEIQIEECPSYSEDDLFCLAAAIYNEAGGNACTDEHRIAVGNVVINRVNDTRFPDSIRDVLEQQGQYSGMEGGVRFAERSKYDAEQEAVQRAYDVAQRVLEGEMICPENVVWQSEGTQGTGTWKKIGNTYFCY